MSEARISQGNSCFIQFWLVYDIIVDFDESRQPESLRCMRIFRDKLVANPSGSLKAADLRYLVNEISSQTTEREYWDSISASLKVSDNPSTDLSHSVISLSRGIYIWLKTFATESDKRKRYVLPPQTSSQSETPRIPPTPPENNSLLANTLRQRIADLESANVALLSELASLKDQTSVEISTLTKNLALAKGALLSITGCCREAEEAAFCLHGRKKNLEKEETLEFEVASLRQQLTTLEAQKADVDLELTSLRQKAETDSDSAWRQKVETVPVGLPVGQEASHFISLDRRIKKRSNSKRVLAENEPEPRCAQQ